ncbi:hypothetical protein DITRI_Ditri07aG0074600 [Diplodiscus trichospermus]
MGCVSIAAHVGGSQVLGIILIGLAERNFAGKTVGEELRIPTMQDSIWKMLDNSNAFIALPGGIGTFGRKFSNRLLGSTEYPPQTYRSVFLDQTEEENFIPHSARQIFISASIAKEMIDKLEDFVYEPDPVATQID